MKTICIYNNKGGVGKTSIAGALAVELVIKGKKVLMCDTDSQANLSSQFMNNKPFDYELADYLNDYSIGLDKCIYQTPYDNATLVREWKRLLAASSPDIPAWREDVVALGCQALGNHFASMRDSFTVAYRANNYPQAKAISLEMKQLLDDIAALAACSPQFRLDRWLSSATSWAAEPEEESYYRHNAWHLLTTWGDTPNLNDYANRLWSGLVTHYYTPRWQLFTDEVLDCLSAGRPFDQAVFDTRCSALEQKVVAEAPAVSDVPASADLPALARDLASRYFPDHE